MDYILYLRASTQRQGQSGLGLEGQRLIAHRFLQQGDRILNEYIEVESGRKNDRPEMAKAILAVRQSGATLLVAEMSRLARSVYFTSKLMEEKVRFRACDLPHADEFTINIMASVAQKAAKDISDNTKRGLAAKKARGFQLGNPQNFTQASRLLGSETVRRNAQENTANKQARRLATLMRENGYTLETIAQELNTNGYVTRRGKQFFKNTVRLLLLTEPASVPISASKEPV